MTVMRGCIADTAHFSLKDYPAYGSLETKLVAFYVLHHDPVLPLLFKGAELRGANATKPLNRSIHTGAPLVCRCPRATTDIHIQVDAVLHHRGLRHPLEVDAWATPLGIDNRACFIPFDLRNADRGQEIRPARIALRRILQLVPQRLRPKGRHLLRVGTVKRDLD